MKTLVPALFLTTLALGCALERTTVSANDPHGIITVGNSQIARDIHPVLLQEIDGRRVPGADPGSVSATASTIIVDRNFGLNPQKSFYLSPGPHRLRLTAIIREDLALTLPSAKRFDDDPEAGLLTLNVAEGARYLLGAKLDGPHPERWVPVAYAVEDIPGYEFGFDPP
ncbi:hypothetical protein BH24PSE2_BH24PSE2_02030 [soil metagenome]